MTTLDYGQPAAFRIGRVFGDSFAVFSRNILLCIGLAFIFSGIPTLLVQWWVFSNLTAIVTDSTGVPGSNLSYVSTVGGFLTFVLGSLLQAALTRASIEDLNGEKPTFSDCLSTALSVVLPVMAIAFLVGAGSALAAILLIVPGVILWLRWSVAVPVQVNERLGVAGSLSRSGALTKGSRWALFGLYLILIVAVIALMMVAGLVANLFAATFGFLGASLAQALVSSISTIAFSIVAGVAYIELRLVKEGVDVKDLAEIFA